MFVFKKNKGNTLITVMLLMISLAAASIVKTNKLIFEEQIRQSNESAVKIRELNDAIEAYLPVHAQGLRLMRDDNCYGMDNCTPSRVFCTPVPGNPDMCYLDYSVLKDEGFLNSEWENQVPWGGVFTTVIKRVLKPNFTTLGFDRGLATEADFNIRAITVSSLPWSDGTGTVNLAGLAQILKFGKSDFGIVRRDAGVLRVDGFSKKEYAQGADTLNFDLEKGFITTWSATAIEHPGIIQEGQLVLRAGFEAVRDESQRDLMTVMGSKSMYGNISLNRQRINNVEDIFIKGSASGAAARTVNISSVMPNWVFQYAVKMKDGDLIPKPDCSAAAGGNSLNIPLTSPSSPRYDPTSASYRAYDAGEPRVLFQSYYMDNIQTLGFCSNAQTKGVCSVEGQAQGSSTPDPQGGAVAEQTKAKAFGTYLFEAVDEGTNWRANMKYYQDGSNNVAKAGSGEASRGIASVYCYFSNDKASGCRGEAGCQGSGKVVTTNSNAANLNLSTNAKSLSSPALLAPQGVRVDILDPNNIGLQDVQINFGNP